MRTKRDFAIASIPLRVLGRHVVTFSDAVEAIRLRIRDEGVFSRLPDGLAIKKLPPQIRGILYIALAPAP